MCDDLGPDVSPSTDDGIPGSRLNKLLGCIGIYALLFAIGSAIYSDILRSAILFVVGASAGIRVMLGTFRARSMANRPAVGAFR